MKDRDDLLELKSNIDSAKSKISELEGQKKMLMKRLKDDYGCTTLKQAKKKLDELNESVTELDDQIQQGIEKLEEQYDV